MPAGQQADAELEEMQEMPKEMAETEQPMEPMRAQIGMETAEAVATLEEEQETMPVEEKGPKAKEPSVKVADVQTITGTVEEMQYRLPGGAMAGMLPRDLTAGSILK